MTGVESIAPRGLEFSAPLIIGAVRQLSATSARGVARGVVRGVAPGPRWPLSAMTDYLPRGIDVRLTIGYLTLSLSESKIFCHGQRNFWDFLED